MDISIIIPNYNGKELLLKNLPDVVDAVSEYKKGKVQLIVADDSSKDGSVEAIKEYAKKIPKTIEFSVVENNSGTNRGFSKNVNNAVGDVKGEIIILLNSDCTPHKDFLAPLLSHFVDGSLFAAGCMDESKEDGKIVLRGRGIGKWEKGFLVHRAGSVTKTSTLWVSGGSGAFRKSIWQTLEGFNELYSPFYWEDIDLSYRAQKAGFKILFEPKSVVIHEHSIGAIKKNYSPFHVRKIVYRNQFFFTWINATDTMLMVNHVLWMPYFLIRALVHTDRAFFVGFFLALLELPQAVALRKKNKKLFIKADREVIEGVRE